MTYREWSDRETRRCEFDRAEVERDRHAVTYALDRRDRTPEPECADTPHDVAVIDDATDAERERAELAGDWAGYRGRLLSIRDPRPSVQRAFAVGFNYGASIRHREHAE